MDSDSDDGYREYRAKLAEFVKQWLRGERKTCDMTFVTRMGKHARCHFGILEKYSKKYENYPCVATKIINVDDLNWSAVESVLGYMYGRSVQVNAENAWSLIKAAYHFEVDELEKYLIQEVKRMNIISVLNFASKDMIEEKPQNAFRCHLTCYQSEPISRAFNDILLIFYDLEPKLGMIAFRQLNVTSIYALMYDPVDLKTKVRIIFLTIDWITLLFPTLQTVFGIIGSLRINISFNMIYAIKYNLHMYLTKYHTSAAEFFIWMDGSSELWFPFGSTIEKNPPKTFQYPVDRYLPLARTAEPRKPMTVDEYRKCRNQSNNPNGRERICGLYQPRGEDELTYSYNEETTHEELGEPYSVSYWRQYYYDRDEEFNFATKREQLMKEWELANSTRTRDPPRHKCF